MSNCKSQLPHIGTEKQGAELLKAIEEHREQKGALMPILQKAQEIYGYLPERVLLAISEELDIPLSEVYGVVTFYSQFSLQPKELGPKRGQDLLKSLTNQRLSYPPISWQPPTTGTKAVMATRTLTRGT